jgi:hypothetical protein
MMKIAVRMPRISPSISRSSSLKQFEQEYAFLQLRVQKLYGAILSISVQRSVSILSMLAASRAAQGAVAKFRALFTLEQQDDVKINDFCGLLI